MIRPMLAAFAASFLLAQPVFAQPSPLDASYSAQTPSPVDALGHEFGAEITSPEAAIDYIRTLATAHPDRMRTIDYATSWEGRQLAIGIITSAANMARLDEIQADLARLADPRDLADADRDALIATTPPVVWLAYGVHGDEISSTDAGLRTAYHLLAAQNDPTVQRILDNTIVIIDPTQNPDGRARFLASFNAARGLAIDESRFSAEHDQPWPGGRYNHYLFDMNRDWFSMSQPESRGRVALMQDWWPVAVVDAHEMGGDQTYFFAPNADPANPHQAASQRANHDLLGRNHARWFDQLGYDYFTREIFDAFYPGYGDMWPSMHGATSMTYEQASARGLAWRRRNGTLLTYGDGVDHHFVASMSTAEVVANNAERFLRNYVDFRAAAADNTSGPNTILLDASANRWGAERLARNLVAQGIEVGRTSAGINACGTRFEAEAFVVRLDQPAGALARTLLESDTPLPADFIVEQEARRADGLGHELYDVTAWSLPFMYNVEATYCRRATLIETTPVSADEPVSATGSSANAAWGYAIPWTDAGQARLVAALAAEGIALKSTDDAFRIGSTTYPRGTVVVRRIGAPADLDTTIARLAAESGARFDGLASSWTDEGPNPGSSSYNTVISPRIALAWGEGTDPTSTGATRYVLEQRYNMPVTIVRTRTLARADLSGFDVVILPEYGRSDYADTLGSRGAERLRRFVRDGGVLVGLGDATSWLSNGEVNLLPAQRERAAGSGTDGGAEGAVIDGSLIDSATALEAVEATTGAMPDRAPGALLQVEANPNAWMSAGYESGASAMVTGSAIYAPIQLDTATTAMRFAGPDDLIDAGYMWAENTAQLAYKPYVISNRIGNGQVIAFTQAPTTRAYLEGLDLLLLNAVILGPAHSRRMR